MCSNLKILNYKLPPRAYNNTTTNGPAATINKRLDNWNTISKFIFKERKGISKKKSKSFKWIEFIVLILFH
jgi:hypothetical protein